MTTFQLSHRDRNALLLFGGFYIIFGTFVTIFQERFVYVPSPQDFVSCSGFVEAEKVTHNGTRMYVREGAHGYVVLYHGNGGSACDRDYLAHEFTQAGYGYIVPEYAGYSNDVRTVTHELIRQDVRNVIEYMSSHGIENELLVGESVGTGVAAYHTSLRAPRKVLLVSPFTDIAAVAATHYWFYPVRLLMNNAYNNVENLKHYTGPVIIMHGDKDTLVPYRLGQELYAQLRTDTKHFATIAGVGHNDLWSSPEAFTALRTFLESDKMGE